LPSEDVLEHHHHQTVVGVHRQAFCLWYLSPMHSGLITERRFVRKARLLRCLPQQNAMNFFGLFFRR
jgi:hypothetical protein